MDERPRAPVAERVHAPEAARVAHVREPRLQEVGAEREHDLGVLERVVRDRVATEGDAVGRPERLVSEGLERHARPSADRLDPRVEERAQAAVLELGDDGDRAPLPRFPELGDPVAHLRTRALPVYGPDTAPLGHTRPREPVGVVEPLERRLAANAERAVIHWVLGAPLELVREVAATGKLPRIQNH